jgi:hypothetical protein
MTREHKIRSSWISLTMLVLVLGLRTPQWIASPAAAQQYSMQANAPANAVQDGKNLRAEINSIYASMRSAHKGDADVSALVQKYIPVGTSFDNAEAVLRAAGCVVAPRRHSIHPGNVDPGLDGVFGRVSLNGDILQAFQFGVTLIPRAPNDYSAVAAVTAAIYIVSL